MTKYEEMLLNGEEIEIIFDEVDVIPAEEWEL